MNAELLLDHFNRISDAPGALPRLRRFFLDLAVRGKLVAQNPGDEPGSELLKQIRAEKARFLRAGKTRRASETYDHEIDDSLFTLPSGWIWTQIRQITSDRGQAIPNREFTYIDVTSINKERGCIADAKVLAAADAPSRARKLVESGDVLYSCVRPYLLNIAVVESEINPTPIASTAFAVLNGFGLVISKYLWIVLRSPFMVECVEAKMRGQAYPAINDSAFAELPFPLPPLAEQQRIVAKVDELTALCDLLESAQRERDNDQHRLTAASHHCLNNGTDASAQLSQAQFFIKHLPRLTTRPEEIKQLRQTIVNLAVSGLLVEQAATDDAATTLLTHNDQTRCAVAKDDHRADSYRQELLAEELKWQVPVSWEWSAMADTVLFIDYRGKTPEKTTNGVRLITAKNVKMGFIDILPEEFISEREYKAWMTRGLPARGDVLFTTEAPMGNAAVVHLSDRFALAQRVICFRPYGGLSGQFLALQIRSTYFQTILDVLATGLTAKGIKAAKLKRVPVVLPPLAEQKRIVAKVGELMVLCDQLDAQITAAHTEASRLLESVLHGALNGSPEPQLLHSPA